MSFPLQKIMITEYDPLTSKFKHTMKNIRTIHNNINTKIKSAIIAYYTMPNSLRIHSKINKSNSMEYYEKVDYKLKQNMIEKLIKNTMKNGYYVIEPTVMRVTQEMDKIANMEHRNIMGYINKEKKRIYSDYDKTKVSSEKNRMKLARISQAQYKSLKQLKNKLNNLI